jgi:hypothetical protein
MKLSATVIGLLITMGTAASPAAAMVHRNAPAHHRSTAMVHRNAPAHHRSAEVCDQSDARQVYDWSRGIRHNPCWPCVSGDESTTSAYPSWEVRPNCE